MEVGNGIDSTGGKGIDDGAGVDGSMDTVSANLGRGDVIL